MGATCDICGQPNNDTLERKKTIQWHLLDGGSAAALRSEAASFERDDRIDGLWNEGSGRVKHACARAQRVKKGKQNEAVGRLIR